MKTIEEQAKDESIKIFNTCSEEDLQHDYIMFKAGSQFAQRWIPVEEEFPSDLFDVLVKSEDDSFTVGYRFQDKWVLDINIDLKITHWRPIELK